jgi:DNA topoisomerase-1
MRQYQTKSKNAQEAHEAIRPTKVSRASAGLNDEQKRLYQLIWQRTVASQMADAKTLRTKLTANIGASDSAGKNADTSAQPIPDFAINGSRILFDGWLKADPDAQQDDVSIPKAEVGQPLTLLDMHTDEKQTQPPPRYSEAGLVKELEARGIGRPSTYASIIKTIVDRGYVEKIDRALKPTDTGDVVSTFLEENFGEYISDSFTAEMEDKLDAISRGEKEYEPTLSEFYKPFLRDVNAKAKSSAKITDLGPAPAGTKCPVCGSPMIIKLGKNGKFLSCSRFPECIGALTMEGKEIAGEKPIGTDPTTGLPIFVKIGRFGPYVQLGEMPKKGPRVKKVKAKKIDGAEIVPVEKPAAVVKPRMGSIPKTKDPSTVTVADALVYLSLPRVLGVHPTTGQPITANNGRFGPYIVHESDFRSLKKDDVYTIELPRALEILAEPKKQRGFNRKKKAEVK